MTTKGRKRNECAEVEERRRRDSVGGYTFGGEGGEDGIGGGGK